MAYLFGDGFDLYSAAADSLTHWTNMSGTINTSGRYGGRCMSFGNSGDGAQKTLASTYTTLIIMGNYIRISNSGASPNIFQAYEGSTNHLQIKHNGATGQFLVTSNGVTLATSTFTLGDNVWCHIQFKFTIGNSGTYALRFNSINDVSGSGDTQNGGTGVIDNVSFTLTGSSNTAKWDDVAVFDTSGSDNNDFITAGEPRFYLQSPASEGTTQDFTPSTGTDNALTTDEVPQNGDTDYNSASLPNSLDLLNPAPLSISNGVVLAVQSRVYARKEDAGTRSVAPIFRINSTNYVQTSTSIGSTYTWCSSINERNPDTSAVWAVADLNSTVQAGYKITL